MKDKGSTISETLAGNNNPSFGKEVVGWNIQGAYRSSRLSTLLIRRYDHLCAVRTYRINVATVMDA